MELVEKRYLESTGDGRSIRGSSKIRNENNAVFPRSLRDGGDGENEIAIVVAVIVLKIGGTM